MSSELSVIFLQQLNPNLFRFKEFGFSPTSKSGLGTRSPVGPVNASSVSVCSVTNIRCPLNNYACDQGKRQAVFFFFHILISSFESTEASKGRSCRGADRGRKSHGLLLSERLDSPRLLCSYKAAHPLSERPSHKYKTHLFHFSFSANFSGILI